MVDQFSVQVGAEERTRRPDVVLFVNGIPLVVFELKNPTDENATLRMAYDQLMKTYLNDIPSLFVYNQVLGIATYRMYRTFNSIVNTVVLMISAYLFSVAFKENKMLHDI